MAITIRGKLPEGARWTHVRVLCPDNPQHGPVYTLTTFDGKFVGTHFESDESEAEYVLPPADVPNALAALRPVTAEEAGGEDLAAQVNAFNEAVFGDAVPPTPSADPAEAEGGHIRHRVRCTRPSCGLDLPLSVPAIRALEDVARKVWLLGLPDITMPSLHDDSIQDVRAFLAQVRP